MKGVLLMSELCPSILSADFNRLGWQLQVLEEEGINILHIDVMDGVFVPSISFGMPVIKSIRAESRLFFDVHLMITEPIRYIDEFVKSGADSITVHLEACSDVNETIRAIRKHGKKVGLSIKAGGGDPPLHSRRGYDPRDDGRARFRRTEVH